MKLVHKKTGVVGELCVEKMGTHQNASNIRVCTNAKELTYHSMKDVFSQWKPAQWKKDGWVEGAIKKKFMCGVPECQSKAECMGFCKKHWTRVMRCGDFSDDVCSLLQKGLYTKYLNEYKSWDMMKQRCYNQAYSSFCNYGARGIKVCDRWLEKPFGFENFLNDMGRRPKNTSLDRIDVDGDYTPENCRWANQTIQTYNRRPMKHSTSVTGVGKYNIDGKEKYRGYIAKNGEYRQKTFDKFEDAVIWRAKQEQKLYGTNNMQIEKLIALVKDWRRQKNIDNPDKQMLHCYEECSEVARLLIRGEYDEEELKLEIGDIIITVIILADILGIDVMECLERSYNKIKNRKGKTVDGNFIKDTSQNMP